MIAIIVAHILDLVTFFGAVSIYGINGEANPLARAAYNSAGLPGVVFLKVAGIAIALSVISGLPESTGKTVGIVVIAAMGLLGAATNAYAIALAR